MRMMILFVGLFHAWSSHAQTATKPMRELLEWNEFFKLTWEDFQGEPDKKSNGDAATTVQIKAVPYRVKDQIRYDVHAYFNRNKSWARDKSASLLKHEQVHFDIAELYARKIRKRILDLTAAGVNDIKVFNKVINELLEESNEVDRQYDLETLHGALSKKQEQWEYNVKLQLKGLKDYKKKRRVISLSETLSRPLIIG